jgi:dCMP deaminase
MNRPDKDTYVMLQLDGIAARSHDPHTKLGCKIVGPDGATRSEGYNGFCRGMDDEGHPERLERPEKYFWLTHCEANGIANAARIGVSLLGCTLYIHFMPCIDCAKLVVSAGITRVVIDKKRHEDILSRSQKFVEEFKRTEILFRETNVKVDWWERP